METGPFLHSTHPNLYSGAPPSAHKIPFPFASHSRPRCFCFSSQLCVLRSCYFAIDPVTSRQFRRLPGQPGLNRSDPTVPPMRVSFYHPGGKKSRGRRFNAIFARRGVVSVWKWGKNRFFGRRQPELAGCSFLKKFYLEDMIYGPFFPPKL